MELRYGEAQPGGLQHSVPGGAPHSSPAGAPHHAGGVLPLLLLSPCQQLLLLLLLLQRRHGNCKVRNEEEKELHRRLVDLCQDGADDAGQGRPRHGVGICFVFLGFLIQGQLVQWS